MKKQVTFKDVIDAFLSGEIEGVSATGTLKIRGDQLVHYNTPIMERDGERFIINASRYSLATGQLQKQIKNIIPEELQVIVKRIPADYNGSLKDFSESR